jgi:Ca2+-binding EF-hand superfamily protein
MQFTPQQLSGGPRFAPRTKIGNWYEEIALEESKLEQFQKRAASGTSSLRRQQSKIAKFNEIVPHSYSEDGIVRFGDYVLVQHATSSTLLACDPTEDLVPGQNKFIVTTLAGSLIPRARNTFRIVRPPAALKNFEDDESDPVLKIGQPFLLACNESLLTDNNSPILAPMLYLSSVRKTERMATKSTNRQITYMTPNLDAEAVWFLEKLSRGKANMAEKSLAHGCPVVSGDSLVFTHRQTNMYLACDPTQTMKTEFGVEMECYADRAGASGKLGLLVSEFKGLSTPTTLSKPDLPSYAWSILLADSPSSSEERRNLPQSASLPVLISEFKNSIVSSGLCGFWDLRSYFYGLEKKSGGSSRIDRNDLKEAIVAWGCPFDSRYLDSIIDIIDERRLGLVDWRDFISLLRGPLPDNRQDVIIEVFSAMDQRGDGVVSLEDLARSFQGRDHPIVTQKRRSEADALDQLLTYFKLASTGSGKPSTVRGRTVPNVVTYETFCNYYADLSAAVESDPYFENIVRSNWSSQGFK